MKFPAKYSQLPNYDYEYYKIISEIDYGISKGEFENIVAKIKNSNIKDKYKHRTHLENLGLVYSKNNNMYLSSVGENIKCKNISMVVGLKILISKNNELLKIFKEIQLLGYFNRSLPKKELVKLLHYNVYNETAIPTISRYITPIINLFDISNFENYVQENNNNIKLKKNSDISNINIILKYVEDIYLKISGEYGKVIALEKIENVLKTEYKLNKDKISYIWKEIYDNINLRYKYNLITVPSWGTKYKGIILGGQLFTHILINS